MKRSLQDEVVAQTQLAKHAKVILPRHEHQMMSSDASQIRIRKEWEDAHHGRRGGNRKWPVWVVLLICELLVNGTPPTTNIQRMYETLHGKQTDDLPSISFV